MRAAQAVLFFVLLCPTHLKGFCKNLWGWGKTFEVCAAGNLRAANLKEFWWRALSCQTL